MMDHLYQLLCIPKAPSIQISDLKTGNFNQFLDVSMKSAASIEKDQALKSDATKEFAKLVSAKSNSANNTMRMVNEIFKSASGSCHLDRERALIDWLQVCVSTAVEFALDPEKAGAVSSAAYNEKKPLATKSVPSPKKAAKKNKKLDDYESETDVSWEEDDGERYDLIGSSDDEYVPSLDDGVVPSKKQRPSRKSDTKPKKTPRKKKNQDQTVPDSPPKNTKEATIPLIKEGAGPKALQKYFADLENIDPGFKSSSSPVLAGGYFARAFFFPSKDSFNVR